MALLSFPSVLKDSLRWGLLGKGLALTSSLERPGPLPGQCISWIDTHTRALWVLIASQDSTVSLAACCDACPSLSSSVFLCFLFCKSPWLPSFSSFHKHPILSLKLPHVVMSSHCASTAKRGRGLWDSPGEQPQPGQLGNDCRFTNLTLRVLVNSTAWVYRLYQICSCLQTSSEYNHSEASLFYFSPFSPSGTRCQKRFYEFRWTVVLDCQPRCKAWSHCDWQQ